MRAASTCDEIEELDRAMASSRASEPFDGAALRAARLASESCVAGLEPRHLRAYRLAAEREADRIEQLVAPLLRSATRRAGAAPSRAEELVASARSSSGSCSRSASPTCPEVVRPARPPYATRVAVGAWSCSPPSPSSSPGLPGRPRRAPRSEPQPVPVALPERPIGPAPSDASALGVATRQRGARRGVDGAGARRPRSGSASTGRVIPQARHGAGRGRGAAPWQCRHRGRGGPRHRGVLVRAATGEVRSVEDLLAGLLLRSGNDAALALAVAVDGSEGRSSTHGRCCSAGSVSTPARRRPRGSVRRRADAAELAVVARAALAEPRIRDLVGARS
jgi:hypothetical protein